MKSKLEKAIEVLAEKAEKTDMPLDAMQYTQAALNAMNALASLHNQE